MILVQEPLQFVIFGRIGPSSKTLKGTLVGTIDPQVKSIAILDLIMRKMQHAMYRISYMSMQ